MSAKPKSPAQELGAWIKGQPRGGGDYWGSYSLQGKDAYIRIRLPHPEVWPPHPLKRPTDGDLSRSVYHEEIEVALHPVSTLEARLAQAAEDLDARPLVERVWGLWSLREAIDSVGFPPALLRLVKMDNACEPLARTLAAIEGGSIAWPKQMHAELYDVLCRALEGCLTLDDDLEAAKCAKAALEACGSPYQWGISTYRDGAGEAMHGLQRNPDPDGDGWVWLSSHGSLLVVSKKTPREGVRPTQWAEVCAWLTEGHPGAPATTTATTTWTTTETAPQEATAPSIEPAAPKPEPAPVEVEATPAFKLAPRHEKMLEALRQEGGQIRNPESSSWRGTLCDLERAGLVVRRYERCVGGQRTVWALVDQATPVEASPVEPYTPSPALRRLLRMGEAPVEASPELAELAASEPAPQELSAAPVEVQPQEVQPQPAPLPSPPKDRVRDPHDRYYTPRRAALPVRELWGGELRGRVVVEPCVGRGDLAAVLEEAGARVVTADVVAPETPATRDLFGHVVRQPDLLGDLLDPAHRARLARLAPQAEWVVTNPPFSLIADVVRAALELAPRVLVLIPWGWLGLYSDRAELIEQLRRVVVVGRVNFLDPQGRRSDQVNRDQVAWAEFGRERREGPFPVEFWRKP